MNKLFKPKCINRIVVFLALLAPIIYLFGTMGTYLMGAHGSLVLAQHEDTIVTDVEYDGNSYLNLFGGVSEKYVDVKPLVDDYQNTYYLWFSNRGLFGCYDDNYVYTILTGAGYVETGGYYDEYWPSLNLASYDAGNNVYQFEFDDILTGSNDYVCFSIGVYDSYLGEPNYIYYEVFYNVLDGVEDYFVYLIDHGSWVLEDHFSSQFWPGFGVRLLDLSFCNIYTAGYLPNEESLNSIRHIPAYYSVIESDDYVENSDYLFGQMFPRDNFLAKVGQNALSDNPMGFAPFGWLLSYLDRNMLHMGASQLAQMGYGYFYWCAHVLLLDVIFYFAVFFIRFIKHLGDMFIKEE